MRQQIPPHLVIMRLKCLIARCTTLCMMELKEGEEMPIAMSVGTTKVAGRQPANKYSPLPEKFKRAIYADVDAVMIYLLCCE